MNRDRKVSFIFVRYWLVMRPLKDFVLPQEGSLACGDAALKSLLAFIHQDERFCFLLERLPDNATLAQFVEMAFRYGVTLKAYRVDSMEKAKAIQKPFVALMKAEKTLHYSLVAWNHPGRLSLYDGAQGVRSFSIDHFQKRFSGYLLTIVQHRAVTLTAEQWLHWNQKPRRKLIAIQIGQSLAISIALYLARFGMPLEWALLLLTAIAIQHVVSFIFSLQVLKRFDQDLLQNYPELVMQTNQTRRFFELKINVFMPETALLNAMFNAYATLLYWFVIDARLLLMLLLVTMVFAPLIHWSRRWIHARERSLKTLETLSESEPMSVISLQNVIDKSYRIAFEINMQNALQLLLLLSLLFLGLWWSHLLTFNLLIILGFTGHVYLESLKKIFDFNRDKKARLNQLYAFISHR